MYAISLSKEDTKLYNEDGYVIVNDKWVIFKTPMGWEWAVDRNNTEFFDPDDDDLYDYIQFDAEETDWYEVDEDGNELYPEEDEEDSTNDEEDE